MKNALLIPIITAAHFTLSKLVPVMTLLLMDTGMSHHTVIHIHIRLMVILTKVFYFPILTFGLYPRHWFPGYWINSAILLNSVLWALIIFSAITLYRSARHLA